MAYIFMMTAVNKRDAGVVDVFRVTHPVFDVFPKTLTEAVECVRVWNTASGNPQWTYTLNIDEGTDERFQPELNFIYRRPTQ